MEIWKLVFIAFLFLVSQPVKAEKKGRKKQDDVTAACPVECKCGRSRAGSSEEVKANCRWRNLTAIPDSFSEQVLWTDIDISYNNITKIHENSFNNVHRVENLELTGNKIMEIHPESFKNLHSLVNLAMERNSITSIPSYLFADSRNIKNLRLTSNLIVNLTSESFTGLHNLEELLLDDNLLPVVPTHALRYTSNLEVLNLAMNRISQIDDDAFSSLKQLRFLDLRENLITRIGNNAMDSISLCKELDLSYNRLTEYPQTVTRLEKLTKLNIKQNQIKHLPDRAFSRQTHLESLNFCNNQFDSVGRWTFAHLRNLTSLEISNVKEQNHFPDLSKCNKLESLSVTGGRIVTIPEMLCAGKPFLKELNVFNNRIYNLSGLELCNQLMSLDVGGNVLTQLKTEEMKHLASLKILKLNNNKISTIEINCFENMATLETLNLSENPVSLLPSKGLENINILNITNTRNLLYLPSKESLPSLHHLYATYPYHCCLLFGEEIKIQAEVGKSNRYFTCTPPSGPLTPCSDLLAPGFARVLLWIVLVLILFFNGFIILLSIRRNFVSCDEYPMPKSIFHERINSVIRKHPKPYRRHSKPCRRFANVNNFDIILCHLCLADLIVTIYLVIIVIYDAKSGGHFVKDAAWWQESIYCRSAGFCLVLGLQLAFYTVLIATLERYLATMFPLNPEKHFKRPVLLLALCTAWVISIATGIVTLYSKHTNTYGHMKSALPPFNGAMCLPWLTDFSYVTILVGVHIFACCVMIILCALLYCTRQKQSWLSAQKNTRLQISLIASCNILCILPLALLGLLASAIISHPSKPTVVKNLMDDTAELNVNFMLIIAMLLICLRLVLDPILYACFNKEFRFDFVQMIKTVFCFDKGKPEAQGYQAASHKEEMGSIEHELPYLDGSEYLANLQSNSDRLQSLYVHIAPNSSELCEELIYPHNSEVSERNCTSEDEETDDSYGLTSEQRQVLYYSSDEPDTYEADAEDEAETSDDCQPVQVHADLLDDPFLIQSNNQNSTEQSQSLQKYLADGEPDGKMKSSDEIVKVKANKSNPDAVKINSAPKDKSNKWNMIIKERKRKMPQLVWQKQEEKVSASNGQMMSHSGESSTSKDSGIQSEPDFGAVAPCSSTSSTLSRSSKGMLKSAKLLPMYLVPPKAGSKDEKTTNVPTQLPLLDADVCFPSLPSAHHSRDRPTYFVLSSTVPKAKAMIKYETTL